MNTENRLLLELDQAELKAWDSLARYKFQMFGYWAAIWVHLNRISGSARPNPWRELVFLARQPSNTACSRTPTAADLEDKNNLVSVG